MSDVQKIARYGKDIDYFRLGGHMQVDAGLISILLVPKIATKDRIYKMSLTKAFSYLQGQRRGNEGKTLK